MLTNAKMYSFIHLLFCTKVHIISRENRHFIIVHRIHDELKFVLDSTNLFPYIRVQGRFSIKSMLTNVEKLSLSLGKEMSPH